MRVLTVLLLAFSPVWACCSAHAQTPAAPDADQALEVSAGDEFLAKVLATLQRRASISARLRHQARLFDTPVMGSGKYWQSGVGKQRRTRWEMQSQVADTTASYVQVFDGEHRWTDRILPSGRKVLRLDVGRLQSQRRTALLNDKSAQPPWNVLLATTEGQGGLAEMLADLLRCYTFAPRRKSQLNGLAAYALVGQWRPEQLQTLWPEVTEAVDLSTWPQQVPHHVLVLVGEDNLFPYVIEHRRAADAQYLNSAAGDRPTQDPLLRYEIFEVQFAAALDDSLFDFKPGEAQWSDETSMVLDRL